MALGRNSIAKPAEQHTRIKPRRRPCSASMSATARAPLKQGHAQQVFQGGDLPAHGGWRHAQPRGGLAHRARSYHFQKVAQGGVLKAQRRTHGVLWFAKNATIRQK